MPLYQLHLEPGRCCLSLDAQQEAGNQQHFSWGQGQIALEPVGICDKCPSSPPRPLTHILLRMKTPNPKSVYIDNDCFSVKLKFHNERKKKKESKRILTFLNEAEMGLES